MFQSNINKFFVRFWFVQRNESGMRQLVKVESIHVNLGSMPLLADKVRPDVLGSLISQKLFHANDQALPHLLIGIL